MFILKPAELTRSVSCLLSIHSDSLRVGPHRPRLGAAMRFPYSTQQGAKNAFGVATPIKMYNHNMIPATHRERERLGVAWPSEVLWRK